LPEAPSEADLALLAQGAPLIQERIALLGEAPAMLGFLFVTGENLVLEADAIASLPQNAAEILGASRTALESIPESEWSTDRVHTLLAQTLIEGLGLKPRIAFGPLRVALSGRKVSPPLFESMEILGQVETLGRLDRALATITA
jgi:glutamyl-tRNA synthetase